MPIDRFDRKYFEEFLSDSSAKWEEGKLVKGEIRYCLHFSEHGDIFVNSSIGTDGFAKSKGKDSIRVWVRYDGKHLKKTQRWTTRMPGWEDRLRKRLYDACKIIRDMDYSPKCPNCDGAMVIRKGVYGKFYGCLKFPKCRGTRPYANEVPEGLEFVKD